MVEISVLSDTVDQVFEIKDNTCALLYTIVIDPSEWKFGAELTLNS